ncbi:hypothetical protein ACFWUP_06420 [Nocardia sp. NPDC058658]|uniref:hypothetical protein n=1 Tax=Nocardia sp. NPDC058658 TaxID=3346580 RepID=UPI0036662105
MLEILWTDDSEAHIAAHGVTPSEVEQATTRPRYLQPGREASTLLFGRTTAGRYLFVGARRINGRALVCRDGLRHDAESAKSFQQECEVT